MEINVEDYLNDLALLKNYLRHNQKISSSDYLGQFYGMVDFFKYIYDIELKKRDIFVNKGLTRKIEAKYISDVLKRFVSFINDNSKDLEVLSKSINSLINKYSEYFIKVEYNRIRSGITTFSEKEFKDIIYSFFSEYGNDTLKIVRDTMENNRIELGIAGNFEGGGLNTFNMLSGNVYILSILQKYSVYNMSTLVHEFGHVIESKKFILPQSKRRFDGDALSEIPSCFFEMAFMDYLITNHIDKEVVELMFNDKMVSDTLSFRFYHDMDENQTLQIDHEGKIVGSDRNLREDVIYFIGYLTGLNFHLISKDNKKEAIKTFDNFMCLRDSRTLKENIESLGIDYDKYLNCEIIKDYIEDKNGRFIRRYIK